MNKAISTIEISNIPDLLHFAEEIRASKKPRMLTIHGESLAMVTPVDTEAKRTKKRGKTKADLEAFLSAAGGWKDIDTDALIEHIYRARKEGSRSITRP